jgi:hypothetical protein
MKLKSTVFAVCAALATSPPLLVHAQDYKSQLMAMQLGAIIGSEEYCGLSYDQDAISNWIAENADPSDMGFTDYLDMGASAEKMEQQGRNASAKTAHCASITRTAKHYGFVADQ